LQRLEICIYHLVAQGDLQKCITWPKNHKKEKKSGIKRVLIIIFPKENECPNGFFIF